MKNKSNYFGLVIGGKLAIFIIGYISFAELTFVRSEEKTAPEPKQLLEKHIQAMGGRTALEKVKTQVIKGTVTEHGREMEMDIQIQAPGNLWFGVAVAERFMMQMVVTPDGKGWRKEGEMVMDMGPDKAGEFYQFILPFNVPGLLQLTGSSTRMETVSEGGRGKATPSNLRIITAHGVTNEFKFDAGGLLAASSGSTISDYRVVDGIKMPFSVKEKDEFGIQIRQVTFNVPLKPGLFDKPKQVVTGMDESGYRTQLSPKGQLTVVRHPPAANFGRGKRASLPEYKPESTAPFQVDLRGSDCSSLKVQDRIKHLVHADFDDLTRWPADLPAGFDPKQIMTIGKNPGLRVRELHRRGITGKGIGLAVIDQTLLVDHVEYCERLRLYEEIHNFQGEPFAAMHGPAVASIAVGKTVGVAPEADLYYIAETHGQFADRKFDWDFTWDAKSIDRELEVNEGLPAGKKIRVISISVGWSRGQKGFNEACAAVEKARQAGVFVISTSLEETFKLAFHGLGREPLADPDAYQSFGAGSWWAKSFFDGTRRFTPGQRLLVAMDARCTASPTGATDYVFYANGGWSWSVPYIAGLYALACQVKPDMTPESFWAAAMKTGNTIQLKQGNETLEFGTIANPVALIEQVQKDVHN